VLELDVRGEQAIHRSDAIIDHAKTRARRGTGLSIVVNTLGF
jgi:hypothetical protein